MNIRCPNCSTLFSASEELVTVGHGLVRCSVCRNVFKAQDYLEGAEEAAQEAASTPALGPSATERIRQLPAWIRSEILSQLDHSSPRGRLWRIIFASLACLALSALLLAQGAYSQLGALAQVDQLRPALAQLCRAAPCSVPPYRELESIRIVDSQISWLDNEDIKLNISINNKAQTAQSYPAIHLAMSNYLNQLVAEGRFLPEDYADDDTIMDAGETVVVELRIANPGQRIRSYDINFH